MVPVFFGYETINMVQDGFAILRLWHNQFASFFSFMPIKDLAPFSIHTPKNPLLNR